MSDSLYGDLVEIIKRDIGVADLLVNNYSDVCVADLAFKIQQILEKTFKLVLYSCSNVDTLTVRKCGHNLLLLAKLIMAQGITIPKDIVSLLSVVNTWESATRYDACFTYNLSASFVCNTYRLIRQYSLKVCFN